MTKDQIALGILRILLGLLLVWAFFDKLFGLGFATTPEKSWLAGGSPTMGFLKNGVHGPFTDFYHSLAGNAVVDWLFMMGLLLIGISLLLGIGVRIASYSGALFFMLMYFALIPPANHPFIDDHIIYAVAVLALGFTNSGRFLGLGEWWEKTALVQKFPIIA
ncbi:MAG: hypothetical protein EPN86_04920 [Nanoarchaeota archaeon]|nr:MAG: hypothetical protein EPN86_04920 [Nanoarchaeota archaeon]